MVKPSVIDTRSLLSPLEFSEIWSDSDYLKVFLNLPNSKTPNSESKKSFTSGLPLRYRDAPHNLGHGLPLLPDRGLLRKPRRNLPPVFHE